MRRMSLTSNVVEFPSCTTLVRKSRVMVESDSGRAAAVAVAVMVAIVSICTLGRTVALAASASEIDRSSTQALKTLYQTTPGSKALADKAKGILVFPNIVKGGFIVAGQYGDGALRSRGRTIGYYRSVSAWWVSKRVPNHSATYCSSWTMIRSLI